MKIYIILLLIVLNNFGLYSQQVEDSRVKKQIFKKSKKLNCFDLKYKYCETNILIIEERRFIKKPQKNSNEEEFFLNLEREYHKKKPSLLSILYSKGGKAISYCDNGRVYCLYKNESIFQSLVNINPNAYGLFRIGMTSGNLFFQMSRGKLKAIIFSDGEIVVVNYEKFVDQYWLELMPDDKILETMFK